MAERPRPAECRSCKAPMYWAITRDGKRIPMNALPDPAGGFVLTLKPNGELHAEAFDQVHHGSARRRYTSHFANCPNADEHRRGRG